MVYRLLAEDINMCNLVKALLCPNDQNIIPVNIYHLYQNILNGQMYSCINKDYYITFAQSLIYINFDSLGRVIGKFTLE